MGCERIPKNTYNIEFTKKVENGEYKNVLLVSPEFPTQNKSRNHHDFLPIGLLRIGGYLRDNGVNIKLIHGCKEVDGDYDLIMITSLFTYWWKYVQKTVEFYRNTINAPIVVGGIYATLLPLHCKKYVTPDHIITGPIKQTENHTPAYDLVNVDYQIINASRGCNRKCNFCGTYKTEPEWTYKKSIKDEVIKKKVVFYDNNLLANPYIVDILHELIDLRQQRKINYVESQSGFDRRILLKKPILGELLYKAGFKNPKIAWDDGLKNSESVKKSINILTNGGFKKNNIGVFMLYNYNLPFKELEQKRIKLAEYGVQIMDSRYKPINCTSDNYNPYKKHQEPGEYYIHPKWTDEEIRLFRKNSRRHNICIRTRSNWHSNKVERGKIDKDLVKHLHNCSLKEVKTVLDDVWVLTDYNGVPNN